MTTAAIPTYSPRVEMLRRYSIRPGQLAPVRDFIRALYLAQMDGQAELLWSCLRPEEQAYVLECVERPGMANAWHCVHGDIATPSVVYEPPPIWRETHMAINQCRLRGGTLPIVKPTEVQPDAPHNSGTLSCPISEPVPSTVLLLPAPKCAGLLTGGAAYEAKRQEVQAHNKQADEYWRVMGKLEAKS